MWKTPWGERKIGKNNCTSQAAIAPDDGEPGDFTRKNWPIYKRFTSRTWWETHSFVSLRELIGGFNPSEKYESQLGLFFPIYGKIKHVPNHQPERVKHPVALRMRLSLLLWWLWCVKMTGIQHVWGLRTHLGGIEVGIPRYPSIHGLMRIIPMKKLLEGNSSIVRCGGWELACGFNLASNF